MSFRLEKFASTLQQALGLILARESLNPDFKRAAVVRVQLARDLKRATVFIACPPEQAGRILEQLQRSRGFIKKQLAAKMILRHMPELDFVMDTTADLERKISGLVPPQGDGGQAGPPAPQGDGGQVGSPAPQGDGGQAGPPAPQGDGGQAGPPAPQGDGGQAGPPVRR